MSDKLRCDEKYLFYLLHIYLNCDSKRNLFEHNPDQCWSIQKSFHCCILNLHLLYCPLHHLHYLKYLTLLTNLCHCLIRSYHHGGSYIYPFLQWNVYNGMYLSLQFNFKQIIVFTRYIKVYILLTRLNTDYLFLKLRGLMHLWKSFEIWNKHTKVIL